MLWSIGLAHVRHGGEPLSAPLGSGKSAPQQGQNRSHAFAAELHDRHSLISSTGVDRLS